MRTALAECEQPRTSLNWIRNSYSSWLLAGLAATDRPLTHDLDDLARAGNRSDAQTVDYLGSGIVRHLPHWSTTVTPFSRRRSTVTSK
ncbi:hypothetical protein [Streptomyces zaomyceticus]|uniref:hypothetical protein n=1 Tax=Streptomyces zaomyceticus TaxID=68286 RepID=UPI003448A05A